MNNVVTGSSGFIGKNLMKKIEAKGLKHEDIVYRHSYNCDRIFFLSTYGNMASHTDASMMIQANVVDPLSMLNGFKGWFCYISTSSVALPVQTSYSRTKRACEEILRSTDIAYCIVRPYSVTGVGEQKEHLIPTLIRSCMTGEPMELVLEAVHDFIDVEDVTDALVRFSDTRAIGVFELGTGVRTSNGFAWKMVEDITGKKANVRIVKEMRAYDNIHWYCKIPFWKCKFTLRDSIERMVQAYES